MVLGRVKLFDELLDVPAPSAESELDEKFHHAAFFAVTGESVVKQDHGVKGLLAGGRQSRRIEGSGFRHGLFLALSTNKNEEKGHNLAGYRFFGCTGVSPNIGKGVKCHE